MKATDYSKYPDAEARTPRETFTAKLRKICAQLDAKGPQTFNYKHWFFDRQETATVEACALWAFGSYARGATTCGDLDLVFETKASGNSSPRWSVLTKAFIGVHAAVRVYGGTPTKNDSGAELDEAVLLWKPGMDWEAALASIKPDPEASRFQRTSDSVPLRMEQHGLPLETVEGLVAQRESGHLTWRFVPLSEIPSAFTPKHERESRVVERFAEQSAMKRKLAPVVFSFARRLAAERSVGAPLEAGVSTGGLVKLGGIRVQAEQLWLGAYSLDELDCTAIAFIPALSVRGPNGFWLIERGPKHPLVKAFEGIHVWTHVGADGTFRPCTSSAHVEEGPHPTAETAEVFSSEAAAQEWATQLYEDDDQPDRDEWKLSPKLLQGREVLELLACVDAVSPYGDEEFALNARGLSYCRVFGEATKVLTAQEVADQLRKLASE